MGRAGENTPPVIFPTPGETEEAANLLVNRYSISTRKLGQLFGADQREQANDILAQLGEERLDRIDVAKLLIMREGSTLAGSSESIRVFRSELLNKLPANRIEILFDRHGPTRSNITTASHMIRPLAAKKWHAGGPWPRDFVDAVGFPKVFAGVVQKETNPTIEECQPLRKPPALRDFQIDLKAKMLTVLERDGNKTRCVVTLPTGGGKTRVAVEAFIDWMQPRFTEGKYLLWIAQSEELCEQAIACIKDMWGSREFVAALPIYRYFGGRHLSTEQLGGG